jgi:hypothetical protein
MIGLVLARREFKQGLTRPGLRRLVAFVLPLTVTGLLYFALNMAWFGQPGPVSGVVKRAWSAYLLSQDPLYQAHGWLGAKLYHGLWPVRKATELFPVYLLLGTVGASLWWLRRHRPGPGAGYSPAQLLGPFIGFSLINYAGYFLLYHGMLSYPRWYYVVQPWLAALLLAGLAERMRRSPLRLWPVAPAGLGLAVIVFTIWHLEQWRLADQTGTIPQPLVEAAAWVKTNLPEDGVIGAWNAGAIGYLSERRVINLDGLVNSWDYFHDERTDLCRYWRERQVRFLVDIFDQRAAWPEAIAPQPTYPAFAACADRLEPIWSAPAGPARWWQLEVYRLDLDRN